MRTSSGSLTATSMVRRARGSGGEVGTRHDGDAVKNPLLPVIFAIDKLLPVIDVAFRFIIVAFVKFSTRA